MERTQKTENHNAFQPAGFDAKKLFKKSEMAANTIVSIGDTQKFGDFLPNQMKSQPRSNSGKVIYKYSRRQAFNEGLLINVSRLAAISGFKSPVAMADAAWHHCVTVPEKFETRMENTRVWVVLTVLHFTLRLNRVQGSICKFSVVVRQTKNRLEDIDLQARHHLGDNGKPAITISLAAKN